MRGGVWHDDKQQAFEDLGEVLMRLKVLKREEFQFHFYFEDNPLLSQYRMFITPFTYDGRYGGKYLKDDK